MEMVYIKNHLKFKEKTKKGMVFRRIWHYQDPEPLERLITDVRANGFWVEQQGSEEPLWVEFMTAKDWAFQDGKVYMIFNHDLDKKRKAKELNADDYSRYCKRFTDYVKELETSKEPKIKGYKILGIYEIVSK